MNMSSFFSFLLLIIFSHLTKIKSKTVIIFFFHILRLLHYHSFCKYEELLIDIIQLDVELVFKFLTLIKKKKELK